MREDVNLEPAFWGQFPGNEQYVVRRALITVYFIPNSPESAVVEHRSVRVDENRRDADALERLTRQRGAALEGHPAVTRVDARGEHLRLGGEAVVDGGRLQAREVDVEGDGGEPGHHREDGRVGERQPRARAAQPGGQRARRLSRYPPVPRTVWMRSSTP